MVPQPADAQRGFVYYMTLLSGRLQVGAGDAVYVTRLPDAGGRHATRPAAHATRDAHDDKQLLDIFRVERLWIDDK